MPTRRGRKWWREQWLSTHYAELRSADLLNAHIRHKGYTIAKVAELATHQLIVMGAERRTVSRQMVSVLCQGYRGPDKRTVKTCSVEVAQAIERALDVPDTVLFAVLEKSSDKREIAKADAA